MINVINNFKQCCDNCPYLETDTITRTNCTGSIVDIFVGCANRKFCDRLVKLVKEGTIHD